MQISDTAADAAGDELTTLLRQAGKTVDGARVVVREQSRLGGHVQAKDITLRLAREIEAGTLNAGPHLAERLSAVFK